MVLITLNPRALEVNVYIVCVYVVQFNSKWYHTVKIMKSSRRKEHEQF